MPTLPTFMGKEKKGIQTGKEEAKLTPFADDMILYIENPEDAIKKLLELINLVKLQATRSTQNLAFLYTSNKLSEREMRKKIPFTIITKE